MAATSNLGAYGHHRSIDGTDPRQDTRPQGRQFALPSSCSLLAEGCVVSYGGDGSNRADHDRKSCEAVARRLAELKGFHYAGVYDQLRQFGRAYWVPVDTLVGVDPARALGIETEHDLFGGVAPQPFIATKSITHPLVDDDAARPEGWSTEFARRTSSAVLPGFSAFNLRDARRAALRLLEQGSVRVKRAAGIGGSGQAVAGNCAGLDAVLGAVDADEVADLGISLERQLGQCTTYSVGQVRVGDLLATYCGTQRLTKNNQGNQVYGGSDLIVVRGDFDALLALKLSPAARRAIRKARTYDTAAFECFTGLLASRRNYDVAEGVDDAGRRRCGVLEQSWRLGGASAAEMEALCLFHADPTVSVVRASSHECYGHDVRIPDTARVYFEGLDPRVGPLTKYGVAHAYVHA